MSDPASVRKATVSAAMARDVILCERRVELDHRVGNVPARPDPVRERLWSGRIADLEIVMPALPGTVVDLRATPETERARLTMVELVGRADHVLGGRITMNGIFADVDVLSRTEGRWTAGLAGIEPAVERDGRRIQAAYGIELGVAARILGATGLGDGERVLVVTLSGGRAIFDLRAPWGGSSIDQLTDAAIRRAGTIVVGEVATRGEAHARCRLCPHASRCAVDLAEADDVTLVRGIDRAARPAVEWVAPNRRALAELRPESEAEIGIPSGIAISDLTLWRDRARLQLSDGGPYARHPLTMRKADRELHVSIGYDPTLDYVWLTGVLERSADGVGADRYRYFLADGADGERRVFDDLYRAIVADPAATVYFRSPEQVERFRFLHDCYREVCDEAEFASLMADERLVEIETSLIEPHTEWPGGETGVLDIARASGMALHDDALSGAALVRLGAAWAEDPTPAARDELVMHDLRLCRASATAVDALAALPAGPPEWPVGVAGVDARPASRHPVGEAASDGRADDQPPTVPYVLGVGPGAATDEARDHARHGRTSRDDLYARPSLRVCASTVQDLIGHEELAAYKVLEQDLPLAGEKAFVPASDGGFDLPRRLRERAPWMESAIAAIERSLRIGWWSGRPWLAWRPLLLVGDPGCGKSRFAREVPRLAGVPYSAVDLGSASDALNLAGVSRGWASATPCWPARAMVQAGVANPCLVADELDKAGGHRGSGGSVHDALLGMLEPGTARSLHDRCLLVDLDVSAVCWMFTANGIDSIPRVLLDRLDVVEVGRPDSEHFDLLRQGIEADLAFGWGVPPASVPELPPSVVDGLRGMFDRHRSARRLRADLTRLLSLAVPDRPEVLH